VLQQLQQINAEDIKRLIKLVEEADEQYDAQGSDGDTATVEPPIISDTFPPSDAKTEMNVADMLVTCNFMFRDWYVMSLGSMLTGQWHEARWQ
jgi:ATP-dependent DNA helicase 2 subunit 1